MAPPMINPIATPRKGLVTRLSQNTSTPTMAAAASEKTNALSPAKVQRVSIVDDRERVMEVIVEDKQLSLAIGKKGQNVRLAAKLTGWRIDIKSEEEKRKEVEAQFGALEAGDAQAQMDALFPDTPSDTTDASETTDATDTTDATETIEAAEPQASAEPENQES